MINKLCVILGVVPLAILYSVKCWENKYWLTVPISMFIVIALTIGCMVGGVMLFMKIDWLPS